MVMDEAMDEDEDEDKDEDKEGHCQQLIGMGKDEVHWHQQHMSEDTQLWQ